MHSYAHKTYYRRRFLSDMNRKWWRKYKDQKTWVDDLINV